MRQKSLSWQFGFGELSAGYELTHGINLISERDFVDDVNEGKIVGRIDDLTLDGFFVSGGFGW